MLTGKCKIDFEEFLIKSITRNAVKNRIDIPIDNNVILKQFYYSLASMQFGVYQDFFDDFCVKVTIVSAISGFIIEINDITLIVGEDNHFTRPEARKKAIEKANEIYNNKTTNQWNKKNNT